MFSRFLVFFCQVQRFIQNSDNTDGRPELGEGRKLRQRNEENTTLSHIQIKKEASFHLYCVFVFTLSFRQCINIIRLHNGGFGLVVWSWGQGLVSFDLEMILTF